ncbi:MAG: membrane protein insertion efficiency factor YidD [Terriglobales bacterium]
MNRIARSFVLGLLRGYKWAISPLLPPACRYVPTCSEYAVEAVDRYGVFRGGLMAMRRVLRCHPFVKGGYDPVLPVPLYSNLAQPDLAPSNLVQSKPYAAAPSGLPPASCAVTE